MPETVQRGAILVEEHTPLPASMQTGGEVYSKHWKILKDVDADGMDREMHKIGWSFFHKAPVVKVTALAFGVQYAIRLALWLVLRKAQEESFNCLEIQEFASRRIFGLNLVTLAAHPRNLLPSRY